MGVLIELFLRRLLKSLSCIESLELAMFFFLVGCVVGTAQFGQRLTLDMIITVPSRNFMVLIFHKDDFFMRFGRGQLTRFLYFVQLVELT